MEKRSPEIQHLLSLFAYEHLPEHLKDVSRQSSSLAVQMIRQLEDGPELREGLRQLLYAKDCFVRQAVADQPPAEKPKYPSGIDWQQRIFTALGGRPGEMTYPLEEAVEKIKELRA